MKRLSTLIVLALLTSTLAFAQDTEPAFTDPQPSEDIVNGPLTTDVEELNGQKPVQIYSYDNQIFINAPRHPQVTGTVSIYELTGRLAVRTNLKNQTLNTVQANELKTGYYLVQVSLSGDNYRSKVFIK